jgi:hypothetical protein
VRASWKFQHANSAPISQKFLTRSRNDLSTAYASP